MKAQLKFKTTINCSGCVASVTPSLDHVVGEGHWQVDTVNPDKILSVESDNATAEEIVEAVKKAGYHIEPVGS
ncbi:heavy-metal-associated domain-containing protein [Parapedobacter tibetensis]|uniref:heavy-metal-associated domain-containing protein n=1 Tax=Parapedobacter tibetensis TaxID=2972951 RepID=UPI00214D60F8|nr:hypothetical protein [Parapedobacter tibetensis]